MKPLKLVDQFIYLGSKVGKWCNHTIELTWLQLGRIYVLSKRSDFQMVINLSIAVHALLIHVLTLLSVDEILLSRYETGLLILTHILTHTV